jgi:cytochrome c peroxidase
MKFNILVLSLFISSSLIAETTPDPRSFTAMFKSLPGVAALDQAQVDLGKKLYLDPILSAKQDLSCNSCHRLDSYGVDNKPTSDGTNNQKGDRNSPTSFNAFLHLSQFWDGRAKDVEEQALGPILNPVEMAMASDKEVLARLKAKPEYVSLFKAAFKGEKDPITYPNVGKAIGAFERTLVTPSKFDKYLDGDDSALNEDEKKGLITFVQSGCTTCHNGVALGGGMYQKLGLVLPYETKDEGRFKVTKLESDKYVFKVPSLRNIDKTGPYFHDGSIKTLPEAIKLMGKHQLGRDLSENDISSIVNFLKALTGEVPTSAK